MLLVVLACTLQTVALQAVTLQTVALTLRSSSAAFSVLGRFHITNFGIFLFSHISFLLLWVVSLRCVSHTEQKLPAANDVSLRNQIVEPDQFVFRALGPSMLLAGQRIFLVLRSAHVRQPLNIIRARGCNQADPDCAV